MRGEEIIMGDAWLNVNILLPQEEIDRLYVMAKAKKVDVDTLAAIMVSNCIRRGERWYTSDICVPGTCPRGKWKE